MHIVLVGRYQSRLDLLLPHSHGHTRSNEALPLSEIFTKAVPKAFVSSGLLFSAASRES